MYIREKSVALVEIPKCASTSLIDVVTSEYSVSDQGMHLTLQQHQRRHPSLLLGVAAIREPMERLCSAVQFCLNGQHSGGNIKNLKEKLLSSLSKGRANNQVIVLYPQYSFLLCSVPVKLYHFGCIAELLADLGVRAELPHRNVSSKKINVQDVVDGFGRDFIKEFYGIDFSLYDRVQSDLGGVVFADDARRYILSLR
jgi:hypothetical protein